MRKPFRAVAALFLLGLAAAPFAACSDAARTASAADSVRAASAQIASHDSVAFEMTIAMEGVAGLDLDVTSAGAYDIEGGQMQMTLDVLGQEVEAVSDGSTVYLKMPMLGDSWYAQEADTSAQGALAAIGEDPTRVLEWLTATGDDVEDLGEEDVRGETARHYRATFDMRAAASELDEEHHEQLEKAIELLGQDTLDVDIWVNGDGLPVRLEYDMSFADSELGELQDASMSFVMEYFDWGEPVSVTLPDPDEVESLEGLLGGLFED